MYHLPAKEQVIIQALIMGIAFTINYSAIFYPLICLVGLLLSPHNVVSKIWGSLLGVIIIISFILYTKEKTKEITGTAEFSVLGSWQIANNALYIYNHIKVDTNLLPKETRELNRLTKQFFSTVPDSMRQLSSFEGSYFIDVSFSPLKQFLIQHASYEDPISKFKAWQYVAPAYKNYGNTLIKQHPGIFARHFLLLNLKNYFLPPLEKFDNYSLMNLSVPTNVQDWFDYITPNISAVSSTFQGKLFHMFPLSFLILYTYFIGLCLYFTSRSSMKKTDKSLNKAIKFTVAFLFLSAAFSLWAKPAVFRYQVTPIILLYAFAPLVYTYIRSKGNSIININNT